MPGLGLQNLHLIFRVSGNAQVNLFIEPARPQDGRVEQIWSIGGSDDEDLVAGGDVHLHQQFSHYPVHHLVRVSPVAALGDESVQLVHEDDAGLGSNGSLEHLPHIFLALPHVHVQQFGALDADEAHLALFGNAFSEEGFAGAGRPVEEEPSSGFDPLVEYF